MAFCCTFASLYSLFFAKPTKIATRLQTAESTHYNQNFQTMPMLPNYHTAQYFDVGALSMEDERVPCSTTVEITGLGYLDPSSQTDDLEAQSKVCILNYTSTVIFV